MRIAGTNVFVATFALGTILALLQPLEAPASSMLASQQTSGQSAAVAFSPTASSSAQLTQNLTNDAKITTFEEQNALIMAMRTPEVAEQEDKTVLASALEPKVQAAVAIHPDLEDQSAVPMVQAFQAEAVIEVAPTATPTPSVASYQLNADVLLEKVNNHRIAIGLTPLQKDAALTDIAISRGPELFDEIFVNGNMHAGFYARNLPYWATENIIYYNDEDGAFNWWMNSSIHRSAIENASYTHTGIACDGKACSQIFTAFVAK
jgi:hypothetical protein